MKVLCIIQARMSSTRLPGKVLRKIGNKSLLEIQLERVGRSKQISQLLVATSNEIEDQVIEDLVKKVGLPVHRGNLKNVLDRFYNAAISYRPEWVVRLTADCPLADPGLIDQVILHGLQNAVDYCSNVLVPSFPDGMDVEVFRFSALERAWREAILDSDKEHVTPFIYNNSSFKQGTLFTATALTCKQDYSRVRLTVDEPKDLEVIAELVNQLGTDKDWKTYADFYLHNQQIGTLNRHIGRNEGYSDSLKNEP